MFIFFLIIVLLIPISMLGYGLLWRLRPPNSMNTLYGYKTSWSMKSMKTWDFAHRHAGILWIFLSVPLGIISISVLFTFGNYDINGLSGVVMIITVVQLIILMMPILRTEIELRKKFYEKGRVKKNINS